MLREGHHLPVSVPSLFVTLSPADTYWPELFKAISPNSTDDEVRLLSTSLRNSILGEYPEVAIQLFWHRWKCFWKHILNGKSKPLGHIADYFIRVEFQMRGSPHLHILFWILEAAKAADMLETEAGRHSLVELVDKLIATWTIPVPLGMYVGCYN